MGKEVSLPAYGWQARDYQIPLWNFMRSGGKRAIYTWHRRAGKDEVGLHYSAVAAMTRPATYWIVFPEYAQARRAIWEGRNPQTARRRIHDAFPPEIIQRERDQVMTLDLINGSNVQIVGSDNYDSLVGAGPAGVLFSEWSLSDPRAWTYIQPMLEENGGWGMFNFTPRGKNHAHSMLEMAKQTEGWFSEVLTAEDTGVFTKEQLARIRAEAIAMGHDKDAAQAAFEQEYLCSFAAAVIGAYYAREIEIAENSGRITSVPYDPAALVHTGWDLGIGDSTAIWFFQQVGKERRYLDFIQASGRGLEWYAGEIKRRGYAYAGHHLPHDGAARELGTGKSRQEILQGMDIGPVYVTPRHNVDDGIAECRRLLPSCWFDKKCSVGIEALRAYHSDYDGKREILRPRPVHDWSSHAADAFRTSAMAVTGTESASWAKPLNIDTRWVV